MSTNEESPVWTVDDYSKLLTLRKKLTRLLTNNEVDGNFETLADHINERAKIIDITPLNLAKILATNNARTITGKDINTGISSFYLQGYEPEIGIVASDNISTTFTKQKSLVQRTDSGNIYVNNIYGNYFSGTSEKANLAFRTRLLNTDIILNEVSINTTLKNGKADQVDAPLSVDMTIYDKTKLALNGTNRMLSTLNLFKHTATIPTISTQFNNIQPTNPSIGDAWFYYDSNHTYDGNPRANPNQNTGLYIKTPDNIIEQFAFITSNIDGTATGLSKILNQKWGGTGLDTTDVKEGQILAGTKNKNWIVQDSTLDLASQGGSTLTNKSLIINNTENVNNTSSISINASKKTSNNSIININIPTDVTPIVFKVLTNNNPTTTITYDGEAVLNKRIISPLIQTHNISLSSSYFSNSITAGADIYNASSIIVAEKNNPDSKRDSLYAPNILFYAPNFGKVNANLWLDTDGSLNFGSFNNTYNNLGSFKAESLLIRNIIGKDNNSNIKVNKINSPNIETSKIYNIDGDITAIGIDNDSVFINVNLSVAANKSTTLGGTLAVTNNTTLGGTLTVAKDTTVGGTLDVTNNTTLGGTLTVAKNMTTTLGGTLAVTNNTTVGGTLSVAADKATTLGGTLAVTNNTTVGGTLAVTNNTTVGGTLDVTNNTTLGGTLTVAKNMTTTLGGTLAVTNNTTVGGTLDVTNNTTLGGTLTVAKNMTTTLGGTLAVTNNTTVGGTLTVAADKATTLGGTLEVAADKATKLGGTLTVTSGTNLNNDTFINHANLTITQSEVFGSKENSGNLSVGGKTTLGGTLTVAKDTTLGGTLTVAKDTTLAGTLTVAKNMTTTLGGALTVDGTISLKNKTLEALKIEYVDAFQNNVTTISSKTYIDNSLTTSDSIYISGTGYFYNGIQITKGGLTTKGPITFNDVAIGTDPTHDSHLATRRSVREDIRNLATKDSAPVGTIMYFAGNAIPPAWKECNGEILRQADYPELFAVIGHIYSPTNISNTVQYPPNFVGPILNSSYFGLPDLRGEFIRAHDTGRGLDYNRVLGSVQGASIAPHKHVIQSVESSLGGEWVESATSGGTFPYMKTGHSYGNNKTGPLTNDGTYNGQYAIGAETRPRNIALKACIKVYGKTEFLDNVLNAQNEFNARIHRNGDKMTGRLYLSQEPDGTDSEVVNASYVKKQISAAKTNIATDYKAADTAILTAAKEYADLRIPYISEITSGWWSALEYTNQVGSFNNSKNYHYVYPPWPKTTYNLLGFIPSIRYIHFAGDVDSNDAIRCEYEVQHDNGGIKVWVQGTEQNVLPAFNYIAFWS